MAIVLRSKDTNIIKKHITYTAENMINTPYFIHEVPNIPNVVTS